MLQGRKDRVYQLVSVLWAANIRIISDSRHKLLTIMKKLTGWLASSEPLGTLQKSDWALLGPIFFDRNGSFYFGAHFENTALQSAFFFLSLCLLFGGRKKMNV